MTGVNYHIKVLQLQQPCNRPTRLIHQVISEVKTRVSQLKCGEFHTMFMLLTLNNIGDICGFTVHLRNLARENTWGQPHWHQTWCCSQPNSANKQRVMELFLEAQAQYSKRSSINIYSWLVVHFIFPT